MSYTKNSRNNGRSTQRMIKHGHFMKNISLVEFYASRPEATLKIICETKYWIKVICFKTTLSYVLILINSLLTFVYVFFFRGWKYVASKVSYFFTKLTKSTLKYPVWLILMKTPILLVLLKIYLQLFIYKL